MALELKILDWDCKVLQQRIGRVSGHLVSPEQMREVDAWAAQEHLSCLYYLCPSEGQTSLAFVQNHGFRCYDVRVTLTGTPSELAAPALPLRPAQDSDSGNLLKLAVATHPLSRFCADPHFSATDVEAVYSAWMEGALRIRMNQIIVFDCGSGPEGYVLCKTSTGKEGAPPTGEIEFIAVTEKHRGTGVARALMNRGHAHLRAQGCTRFEISTQANNRAAMRLYEAAGYRTECIDLWFHKWYRE